MCGCERTSILSIFPLSPGDKKSYPFALWAFSAWIPSTRRRRPWQGPRGRRPRLPLSSWPGFSVVLLLLSSSALRCWRAELAGCAQRDSAEPVKQSGVREGQRCRRSPLSLSLPQPLFRGRSMGSKLPSPSHIGCLQRGASRLHWLGTRAAAVVSRDDGSGVVAEKTGVKSLDNRN